MLGKTLNRRYKLEQLLARGEQGTLFLATEATSGEMLAVKVFPPEVDLRDEGGRRYLRAMGRLKGLSHPNFLFPIETGFAEGRAFQAVPYFPALSLKQALEEAPFSRTESLELLRQLAAALACLHGAGVAHLNLKPTNILVSREGGALQAVLVDPARPLLAPADFPYGGAAAGPYRSPEEIPALDRTPDARSDLYGLAMIGYLVLTGKPPFAGITARQTALNHLTADPPAIEAELDAEGEPAAPELGRILARLAAKDPAARYRSAGEVLADLAPNSEAPNSEAPNSEAPNSEAPAAKSPQQTGGGPQPNGGPPPAGAPRAGIPLAETPLLGRGRELEAALAALARARAGRGTLLVMAAPEGSGRRSLFEALAPRAVGEEALVLRADLPQAPWCAPLQAPLLLLRDFRRQWETLPVTRRRYLAGRLAGVLGRDLAVLTGLFPPLRELLREPKHKGAGPPPLPAERERFRTLHVLTETFAALAETRHPLVVWLGGAENADADSVAWLESLLLRLPSMPALVVAGYAAAENTGRGSFQKWVREAVKEPAVRWLELPPLDGSACRELTAAALAAPPTETDTRPEASAGPEALPARLAEWLGRRWGGNPLAHRATLALLAEREILTPAGPGFGWECDWERLEQFAPPDTLAGLIAERAALLDEQRRQLLGAASVFPGAFSLTALAGLLEHLPEEVVLERVERALDEGFLLRSGGKLRFAHDLWRREFYTSLPQGRKTHFHRLLAALGETQPAGVPMTDHFATARHFLLGGDATRYVRHALAAAHEARQRHACWGAAEVLTSLLPHLGNDSRLPETLVALAECHFRLGDSGQALETLSQTQGLDLGDTRKLEILHLGGAAETQRGEAESALPALKEALGMLGESLPGSQMGAVLARLARGARRRYVELRMAAGGPAPEPLEPNEQRRALLLEQTALALAAVDPERSQLADERLLQFTATRRPSAAMVRALLRLGEAHGNPDDPYLLEAGELCAQGGFSHEEAERQTAIGRTRFNLLDLRGAREALFRAHEGFSRFGDPVGKMEALRWIIEVERLQGPSEALLDRSDRLARLHRLADSDAEGAWGRAVRAYCEALAGKRPAGEAAQQLRTLAEKAREKESRGAFDYFLFLSVDLLLGAGRQGDAWNFLEAFPSAYGEGGNFWGLLLRSARAEAHLVQAEVAPEDREWHLGQGSKHLAELRAAGKAFPRLAIETARLEMMAHLGAQNPEAALECMHRWEGQLDAQAARVALGRMAFRLAEGLKAQTKGSWRRWGNKALSLFETSGVAPFAQAARDLLEQAPADGIVFAEPGWVGGDAPGRDAIPIAPVEASLLGKLEDVLKGEVAALAALHRPLLQNLVVGVSADFGLLLFPDDQGRLVAGESWAQEGEVGEINRSLVETVWGEGRAELVERFVIPAAEAEGPGTHGGAASALCVPLAGGGETTGVVYLARRGGAAPFDQADLSRAGLAAHQAGIALALGGAVEEGRRGRQRMEEDARHWELLADWGARAGDADSAQEILAAYLREAGYPNGFAGALLYWADEEHHRLCLGPSVGENGIDRALAPFATLSLLGAETEAGKALQTAAPVAARMAGTGEEPGREGELLAALGAGGGVWLPVNAGERTVGALLLFSDEPPQLGGGSWEARLARPLRMIAPALHQARRADLLAAQRDALLEKETALLETTRQLERFVPAHLRAGPGAPADDGASGSESWSPIAFGQIFDLGDLARLGKKETMQQLGAYYEKVNEALALHQGLLERILGHQWVARYERGAENALWGTQTMYQLLLALQEERAARGMPLMKTGLGIHLGTVIGGTVETEQRIEPVLVGEGIQVAARLAEMCRTFRAGILVSEEAVQALETAAPFDLRSLGRFRIGPGGKKVGVYDLFSTREPAIRESMRARRGEWNAALRHHQLGQWQQAAELFRAYLARLPHDRPARQFLRQCRQRAARGEKTARGA
ncbi:MAG: AAA family ATPase [bacterium]